MKRRILVAVLVAGMPALCQPLVEFNAKIGIPVSETVQTSSYDFLGTGLQEGDSATRRYTAGAGVVLNLPHRFGAEADVLYQRLGYDLTTSNPALPVVLYHTWTTANSWEFPILGVYRPPRLWHLAPRIAAGVSFRAVTGGSTNQQCVPTASLYNSFCSVTTPTPEAQDGHLNARSSFGGTFGGGIETHLGPIRLTPEVRYTRWQADAGSAGGALFVLRSNPNQIDFLLGVGLGVRRSRR